MALGERIDSLPRNTQQSGEFSSTEKFALHSASLWLTTDNIGDAGSLRYRLDQTTVAWRPDA